jgi:hypothetical protein
VLYVGGARYANISSAYENELGLDYSRVYDASSNAFTRSSTLLPFGRSWYGTAALMPDATV